ncbi:hypothetical protein DTO021C3_1124 [Paecilomyces variotii]|nr:hypothetical protein DTO021C3_1124 [Paecilomyces variotii]
MVLPRTAAFRTLFASRSARAGARASSRVSSRCQQLGRRSYASQGGHGGEQKSSDLPWAVGAVAITVPSAYLLLSSGPELPHGHEKEQVPKSIAEPEEPREEAKEEAEPEAPKEEAKKEEAPEGAKEEEKEKPAEDEKPSQYDQPGAVKMIDGAGKTPGSISGKQEGLDNANTSNPFTTAPGKSEKVEGDVETAKLKGSVDPQRPEK